MIVFTTLGCRRTLDAVLDEEDKNGDYCQAVINGPNTTLFFENDSITFSAYLESWYKRNNDDQRPALTGVLWESDIEGIISSQDYPDWKFNANHSFIRSDLTLGKHIIACTAGNSYGIFCSDTIYIEILAGEQIDRVEFGVSLDIADTKLTQPGGYESYGTGFGCDLNSIWGTSSLSDNVYTTTFANVINLETTYNGYLNITFLDDPRRVNIDAEWSETQADCVENFKIDYDGIPFEQSFNSSTWDLYSESGSSVSRINVNNERVCSWGTRELLNTKSADDAIISLDVYYQE